MTLAPLLSEPLGALLQDVADPPERLDVLVQRRTAEDADLRDVRRAIARQAPLAFDALDHRALFAADVRAGAAAQLDESLRRNAGGFERRDLASQDLEHAGILVAHIEIDALRVDGMRRDQRAFERAVRVALEEPAVFECAGLALVAVDRHQARPGIGAHELPFLAGRKPRAAEAAQAEACNFSMIASARARPSEPTRTAVAAAGAILARGRCTWGRRRRCAARARRAASLRPWRSRPRGRRHAQRARPRSARRARRAPRAPVSGSTPALSARSAHPRPRSCS